MTATERVRELLDERGVEWRETALGETRWLSTVLNGNVSAKRINDKLVLFTGYKLITPEQAIEATLGRELDDAAMAKLHDRMNAVLFEYERAQGIEKRDGDEAIVVPWVVKMHALLEEAATLGRVTCEIHDCEGSFSAVNRPVWRCDCGAFMTQFTDATTYHKPRFCPNCGRKVVDE